MQSPLIPGLRVGWSAPRWGVTATALLSLWPMYAPAEAEEATDAQRTIEAQQRELEARDELIRDLERRVEALEREFGSDAGSQPPAPAQRRPPEDAPPEGQPPRGSEATGPRNPGELEVDEEAVATALERALIQEGIQVLPPGAVQVEPRLAYSRRSADAPGLAPTEDGQQQVAITDRSRFNTLTTGLTVRWGLPFDSQIAVDVPYWYVDASDVRLVGFSGASEEGRSGHGLGDVNVSLSKRLVAEAGGRPNLFLNLAWDSDTGETENRLRFGSGFEEFTASLNVSKSQDPLVFVGALAYTYTRESAGVQPGGAIGASLGAVLAASPETSLRFILRQSFADETEFDGRDIPGSDTVASVFSIGASSIVTPRMLLDVELSIGLTDDTADYALGVSLPIRF